jgi:hypothetical protein
VECITPHLPVFVQSLQRLGLMVDLQNKVFVLKDAAGKVLIRDEKELGFEAFLVFCA